ncbi:hypothetical protein FKX85_16040 [Echinicola soli]|uniref:Outer membrane protein beta-barrel domain-containing protein n=1 Tax=Echinicola soli TaxID=2591634 RepID=A0A514CKX1_9BACT|nr:hypothetical protein [Echinicola soli]QDH80469.1 hypothetical protein FKX85_16040 [Echinicola soli]
MKKVYTISLLFLLTTPMLQAQHYSHMKSKSFVGIGLGLPYGGIGLKFTYNPINMLSVFGGLGYNLGNVGSNAGIELEIPSQEQSSAYFTAMYGYNGATRGGGHFLSGKNYYGVSFGGGIKINSKRVPGKFVNIGLLIPLRSEEFESINNRLDQKAWPMLITVGLNFMASEP